MFQITQDTNQRFDIMSIHRSEITKIETFEQVTLLEHTAFESIAQFLQCPTELGNPLQMGPRMRLDLIIAFGCSNTQQILFECPDIGIDRHAVIIENHQ